MHRRLCDLVPIPSARRILLHAHWAPTSPFWPQVRGNMSQGALLRVATLISSKCEAQANPLLDDADPASPASLRDLDIAPVDTSSADAEQCREFAALRHLAVPSPGRNSPRLAPAPAPEAAALPPSDSATAAEIGVA